MHLTDYIKYREIYKNHVKFKIVTLFQKYYNSCHAKTQPHMICSGISIFNAQNQLLVMNKRISAFSKDKHTAALEADIAPWHRRLT